MTKLEKANRQVNAVLAALHTFNQTLAAKGEGFDLTKIEPHFKNLEREVTKQGNDLIELSKVPDVPRDERELLKQISKTERLSPALLAEIDERLKVPAEDPPKGLKK